MRRVRREEALNTISSPIGWALMLITSAVLVTRPAEACSPGDPQVERVVPTDVDLYPSNAAIVVEGYRLIPDGLSATVDGSPVALVVVPELSKLDLEPDAFQRLAVRLDPQPQPGQTVAIVGDPCELQDQFPCAPLNVQFTASEPDDVAPTLTGQLSFDLVRYIDTEDVCGVTGSEVWVVPEYAFESADALTIVRLEASHPAVEGASWSEPEPDFAEFGEYVRLRLPPETIGDGFPFESWCVSMVLVDAASNFSAPIESCSPCMGGVASHLPFARPPVWEPIPGGACDESDGSTDTGEETGEDPTTDGGTGGLPAEEPGGGEGCACGVEPRRTSGLLGLFVLLFACVGRRRAELRRRS